VKLMLKGKKKTRILTAALTLCLMASVLLAPAAVSGTDDSAIGSDRAIATPTEPEKTATPAEEDGAAPNLKEALLPPEAAVSPPLDGQEVIAPLSTDAISSPLESDATILPLVNETITLNDELGANTSGTGWTYTVAGSIGTYTITGSGITITGTTTNKIIVVTDVGTHNLTLSGASIDVSDKVNTAALAVTGNGTLDETMLNLTLSGENALKSGSERAGLQLTNLGSVVIAAGDEDGLTATSVDRAAGIGTGYSIANNNVGSITISGGKIDATGGSGAAGIGTGINSSVRGNITISGGKIDATGG
jgi:hypothetical protein